MIAANVCRVVATGNGVTTTFAYNFPVFADTDLVITTFDTDDVPTVLVLNTDYTVTGTGSGSSGGNVVLTAALTNLYTILILRSRPIVQTTDIRNQGAYFPEIHENAFDSGVMISQQLQEQLNRSMLLKETDPVGPLELPVLADRASMFLAFDASGNPIASSGGISPAIPVSAFIQTLLDDVDAAAARATLGTRTAAEVLLNKSLEDSTTNFVDNADNTKKMRFELSGVTTGNTRVMTPPNQDTLLIGQQSAGETKGTVPTADGSGATTWISPFHRNLALNGDFGLWQRYGATPSQTVANTISTYMADRFYIKNSLGTNGVITGSRVAGAVDGSKYGISVKITTAPTAAQVNGTELYHVLENRDALRLYNSSASFGAQLKAIGNVTQVGISFVYETTEIKPATSAATPATKQIGSEVLVTVNTSGFLRGTIDAQAIGTLMTSAGVIGIRIRITAVSSGNVYDLNNGFIVEQFIISKSSYAPGFTRNCASFAEEVQACLRYYEKSSADGQELGAGPGFVLQIPALASSANNQPLMSLPFRVEKRATPTIKIYSDNATADKISNFNTGSDVTVGAGAAVNNGVLGISVFNKSGGTLTNTASDGYCAHYTADADI